MKLEINIRTGIWFTKPSLKIKIEDISSIDQIDQAIEALQDLKNKNVLMKEFYTLKQF